MSTSASLTRLMLWPNSVTSSSAVSWSITSLTVTGMPILNRDLTRSAARSAMRLASSPTVIASGTTTSRTCLADGPACIWARFSFSRERRSAASERARASPSSPKRAADGELAALAAMLLAAAGRAGRLGALGRAWPWPWRGRRRSSSSSAAGAAAGGGLGAAARRRGGPPPRRRGGAASAASSSALRLSSARRFSSSVCGLGLLAPRGGGPPRARQSRASSASRSSFSCNSLRAVAASSGARGRLRRGLGSGARATGSGAATGSGFGASASPGRPRMRRFLTSTTTVFERPWLKLCFTLPVSTVRFRPRGARVPSFGLSVVSLTQNPSFKSAAEAPGVSAVAALSPASRPIKARHRSERVAHTRRRGPIDDGDMYHIFAAERQ